MRTGEQTIDVSMVEAKASAERAGQGAAEMAGQAVAAVTMVPEKVAAVAGAGARRVMIGLSAVEDVASDLSAGRTPPGAAILGAIIGAGVVSLLIAMVAAHFGGGVLIGTICGVAVMLAVALASTRFRPSVAIEAELSRV
jgi:hypothetical protein